MATPTITTSFLLLSDTHGKTFGPDFAKPSRKVDVAIHCGDLTQESKLEEFVTAIRLLGEIDATLKLVIAGNHELTLDTPVFEKHLELTGLLGDPDVDRIYGRPGEARDLLEKARSSNIIFLDQGTHQFTLENGACLTVYASPFTPRKEGDTLGSDEAGWAFQYDRAAGPAPLGASPSQFDTGGHHYDIQAGTDVVVTHGPPLGIMDQPYPGRRAGCPDLFAAVARAWDQTQRIRPPQLHCFGHIHAGWGAKLVAWRETISDAPSHFTDIDNEKSVVLEKLASLRRGRFDDDAVAAEKAAWLDTYRRQGFCLIEARPGDNQTLFVNAAVEGSDDILVQPLIVVELDLPRQQRKGEEHQVAGQTT